MSKIIVLQGVPACGKSTWAKKYVKDHPDTVIVCRDSIREGTGTYWNPDHEDYISTIEEVSIRAAITAGLDVIIDATNLNPKTIEKWNGLAKSTGSEIEFKLFEISYEEALARDEQRKKEGGRSVGKEVIRRFFKKYFPEQLAKLTDDRVIKQPDYSLPSVVICDIDGTVALRNGRSPYDLTKVSEDTFDPRMNGLLCDLMSDGLKVIFVSGRDGTEQCVKDTKHWIQENIGDSNDWDIIFRQDGDHRNDAIVKEEIYEQYIKDKYNVVCVFDDRDRVVKMWRDKGLLCCQVYYGDF
jgi:predicted kinase